MRIPVSKILALSAKTGGYFLSGYTAKAIRDTEEKPSFGNIIAQFTAVTTIGVAFNMIFKKLWEDTDLDIEVGPPTWGNKYTRGEKFVYKSARWINKHLSGKMSAKKVYRKIDDAFFDLDDEVGCLTMALFFTALVRDPDVGAYVREDSILYPSMMVVNGVDYGQERINKERAYLVLNEKVMFYDTKYKVEKHNVAITYAQWNKVISILLNDTTLDPADAIEQLDELYDAALFLGKETDRMDFESIPELIDMIRNPHSIRNKDMSDNTNMSDDTSSILGDMASDLKDITKYTIDKMSDGKILTTINRALQSFNFGMLDRREFIRITDVIKEEKPNVWDIYIEQHPNSAQLIDTIIRAEHNQKRNNGDDNDLVDSDYEDDDDDPDIPVD